MNSIFELQQTAVKSSPFVVVVKFLFFVSLWVTIVPTSLDETIARIEVDQSATKVLRDWIANSHDEISAIRVESPNLEFAFRVNGQIVSEWYGDDLLSKGYSDEEYRSTNYDFKVTVVCNRETSENGETIVSAKSRINISTRKALDVHLNELTSSFSVPKPQEGVLFFDSEWFKKTKPWTEKMRKKSGNILITIWCVKLDNYVDRQIVNGDNSPSIELVARLIR